MTPEGISRAIVLYTGHHEARFPMRDVSRLEHAFGESEARELSTIVQALDEEFYLVEPEPQETNVEAANRALIVFRTRHPELREEALEALWWCYTFDWK